MSIEWLRDLIICINGIVAIGFFIFLSVLACKLYRRAGPVLETASAISTMLAPMVAVVQGIRQGIATFGGFFSKKQGG